MELIAHRVNTIHQLVETPVEYGIEIDIRSSGHDLILHHDPFEAGVSFSQWLKEYRHGTLILNVKEEGLEQRITDLMKLYDVSRYFFLDMSFPFMVRWSAQGMHAMAVRYSELEPLAAAMAMQGKARWVWIDCFTTSYVDPGDFLTLKASGFRICLVSPELVRGDPKEIGLFRQHLDSHKLQADAVCTKKPSLWA